MPVHTQTNTNKTSDKMFGTFKFGRSLSRFQERSSVVRDYSRSIEKLMQKYKQCDWSRFFSICRVLTEFRVNCIYLETKNSFFLPLKTVQNPYQELEKIKPSVYEIKRRICVFSLLTYLLYTYIWFIVRCDVIHLFHSC